MTEFEADQPQASAPSERSFRTVARQLGVFAAYVVLANLLFLWALQQPTTNDKCSMATFARMAMGPLLFVLAALAHVAALVLVVVWRAWRRDDRLADAKRALAWIAVCAGLPAVGLIVWLFG